MGIQMMMGQCQNKIAGDLIYEIFLGGFSFLSFHRGIMGDPGFFPLPGVPIFIFIFCVCEDIEFLK
jgi:hypothetical protein